MHFPTTVLFFPGIVFHELSHVVACLITGVKIHKVKWFGTTEAFVQHDAPGGTAGLVISLAPLILGNFIGIVALQLGSQSVPTEPLAAVLLFWIGISLVLFSFPSRQDAENTFAAVSQSYQKKVFGKAPLVTRTAWAVTAPFVFVPLILLLGSLLIFDYFFVLRILWLAGAWWIAVA